MYSVHNGNDTCCCPGTSMVRYEYCFGGLTDENKNTVLLFDERADAFDLFHSFVFSRRVYTQVLVQSGVRLSSDVSCTKY